MHAQRSDRKQLYPFQESLGLDRAGRPCSWASGEHSVREIARDARPGDGTLALSHLRSITSAMTSDTLSRFSVVASLLEEESQLREKLRIRRDELDAAVRLLEIQLGRLHYELDWKGALSAACAQLRTVGLNLQSLQSLIPEGMFYKYNDLWRQCSVHIVQSCMIIRFLEEGVAATPSDVGANANDSSEMKANLAVALVTKEQVLAMLVEDTVPDQSGLRLDLEEYLLGLCAGIQELTRLAANRVVLGDYKTPGNIATFCNQVYAGFRLLNFRNDSLRRSYDALKYALQRLDGIQYDLRIRKLA